MLLSDQRRTPLTQGAGMCYEEPTLAITRSCAIFIDVKGMFSLCAGEFSTLIDSVNDHVCLCVSVYV